MFKNFLMKQLLKKQLKGMPETEQEKIISMVEKNPDFFMKIAKEVEVKVKGGMDQQAAVMEVMRSHEAEARGVFGNQNPQ